MRDIYAEAQQVISYLGPATEALESDSPKDIARDIASRPYWTRVWIIQEFVLGKDNVLQCGNKRFHYKDFAQRLSPKSEFTKQMAELMGLKRMWSSSSAGLPFTTALRFSATAKATDTRDTVFGILGLVRSEEVRSLQIDYRLSACEVLSRAVEYAHANTMQAAPMFAISVKKNLTAKPKLHNRKHCDGRKCGLLRTIRDWPFPMIMP